MNPLNQWIERLPHKEPFLFVDNIVDLSEDSIITEKTFTNDAFFNGHFPGHPVVPGVILNESCFQAGALMLMASSPDINMNDYLTMVSRINNVKFKNPVFPHQKILIQVTKTEVLGQAYYMKAKITRENKTVSTLDFTVNLVRREN